jgi:hypothetical protein
MFDDQPMNDFDVNCLERQLSNIDLSPSRPQRERLLYACGRAAGLAEMRRRLRTATATAFVFVATSAALCLVLMMERAPHTTTVARTTAPTRRHSAGPPASVVRRLPDVASDGRDRQLTASTRFTEFTTWDAERRVASRRSAEPGKGPMPVLTVAGALLLSRFTE